MSTPVAKVQPIRRVATKWQNCGKQDPLRIPHLFLSPDQGPKCFKFAGKLECKRQWLTLNQPQIWVLHQRFSLPVGTRSMDYLTTVLKPKFEEKKLRGEFPTMGIWRSTEQTDRGSAGLPNSPETKMINGITLVVFP